MISFALLNAISLGSNNLLLAGSSDMCLHLSATVCWFDLFNVQVYAYVKQNSNKYFLSNRKAKRHTFWHTLVHTRDLFFFFFLKKETVKLLV
jgi:hypothetical protein